MKKIVILAAVAFLSTGVAFAKPNFAKEVGLKCAECHVKGMKGKTEENKAASPLFAKAFEMNEKLTKQEGDFKGKKTCNDCHAGKSKPEAPAAK